MDGGSKIIEDVRRYYRNPEEEGERFICVLCYDPRCPGNHNHSDAIQILTTRLNQHEIQLEAYRRTLAEQARTIRTLKALVD